MHICFIVPDRRDAPPSLFLWGWRGDIWPPNESHPALYWTNAWWAAVPIHTWNHVYCTGLYICGNKSSPPNDNKLNYTKLNFTGLRTTIFLSIMIIKATYWLLFLFVLRLFFNIRQFVLFFAFWQKDVKTTWQKLSNSLLYSLFMWLMLAAQEHDIKARTEEPCQNEITDLLWWEYNKEHFWVREWLEHTDSHYKECRKGKKWTLLWNQMWNTKLWGKTQTKYLYRSLKSDVQGSMCWSKSKT